jgi:hypothetical protein
MIFDFDALDLLGEAFLSKRWIFAKTMPQNPHWYTLRREWNDDIFFDRAVKAIRKIGRNEFWHGRKFTTANVNGMKYWTMGAPIPATILINRKYISPFSSYDDIAENYDGMFSDPESLQDNQNIVDLIQYHAESVLDIGCGTGLLLDYIQLVDYVGIDPSRIMLKCLENKYPKAQTIQTLFEEYAGPKVDLVISLFGSANHIHPEAIARIPCMVKKGGRWFVMFYKDDYFPITYIKSGIEISHHKGNHLLLPGKLSEFGNFWIVQGKQ